MGGFQYVRRGVLAGALGLVLSGCAGDAGRELARPHRGDAAFMHYLGLEYDRLAAEEARQFDWLDANLFAEKATRLRLGLHVAPARLADWRLSAAAKPALTKARQQLLAVFADGAKYLQPRRAAAAQSHFDCWVEEQEENWQKDKIVACRQGFADHVAALQARVADVGRVPPEAPRVTLEFDLDSSQFDGEATAALAQVIKSYAHDAPAGVKILGHADNLGSFHYNNTLAQERARAVATALRNGGMEDAPIEVIGLGENTPLIWYDVPQPERQNRRVDIVVPAADQGKSTLVPLSD